MISGLYLKNGQKIVTSNIEKISADEYNDDPDLIVENPYEILLGNPGCLDIVRYLSEYTDQNVFSFRTEDVLTIFKPNADICKQYVIANGIEEQLELQIKVNNQEAEAEAESL
jgi:hypothetical protein